MGSDLHLLKESHVDAKKVTANYKQLSCSSEMIRQFLLQVEAKVFSWKKQNFFYNTLSSSNCSCQVFRALVKIYTD